MTFLNFPGIFARHEDLEVNIMDSINNPLEFEQPLVELERQLDVLRDTVAAGDLSKRDEYNSLEKKVVKLRNDLYSKLTPYQRVQLSRHFDRPITSDYLRLIVSDFTELHGDRLFRDDPAIIGGIGMIEQSRVVIIGQERGHSTNERLQHNFGMPQPEGYRKALRLFRLAEKFALPVVTLIDTQGAYPGVEAEERGQAEAIARNLMVLADLKTPVVCVVIGEGGSGGALALGVGDRILMLENACYSVITPEGCASILWHRGEEPPLAYAAQAAEALQVTAQDLKRLAVVDEIIPEPLGGAHRNHRETADSLKGALLTHLEELSRTPIDSLVAARYNKFRKLGPLLEGSK